MSYRIGIDVGGTFTDLCVVDLETGDLATGKTATVAADPGRAVARAVAAVAAARGRSLAELLGETELVVYGTTVSTNAVITGRVGKVGLLATAGFRDVLAIREGAKGSAFDYRVDYPAPYVPRSLTLPVRGRIGAEGAILEPLEPEDVRQAARRLLAAGVDAIAVAFLWSFVNPEHELAARELVLAEAPGIPCVLSHEVNPILREYRRTIATAIDASLQTVVRPHLASVEAALRDAGLRSELLVISSSGGVMSVPEMAARPIFTVGSGPTLAPVAAREAARRNGIDADDLLVVDMGGTSFDISLVSGGRVHVSRETRVGADLLGIARVDVRSIGAGGGSVASVDEGGVLHVGPASAGAEPGPACYGRGGERPTVTDADLILGYLPAGGTFGDSVTLDLGAAERAVGSIAGRLGVDLVTAAAAIYATVNQNMVNAIEDATIRVGVDPAESTLVAGGGASGAHVVAIARELGIGRALVPAQAGTLSAWGGLVSDIRHDFSAARFVRSDDGDLDALGGVLAALVASSERFLRSTGRDESTWLLLGSCEARYAGQIWELELPLPEVPLDVRRLPDLVERFHRLHEQTYGFSEPGQVVEFLQWTVGAVARIDSNDVGSVAVAAGGAEGRRRAFFEDSWHEVRVLPGELARTASEVDGPAIVEDATTTVVVPPGWTLEPGGDGAFLLVDRVRLGDPLAAARELSST